MSGFQIGTSSFFSFRKTRAVITAQTFFFNEDRIIYRILFILNMQTLSLCSAFVSYYVRFTILITGFND